MTVSLQPNVIVFHGEKESLSLIRVKKVYVYANDPAIGTVFSVVCGSKEQENQEEIYTFIAE